MIILTCPECNSEHIEYYIYEGEIIEQMYHCETCGNNFTLQKISHKEKNDLSND